MKYLLISCLILLGCKEKKIEVATPPVKQHIIVASTYPRFVKNKCGQWAVQTSKADTYYPGDELGAVYYLGKINMWSSNDKNIDVLLREARALAGDEYQFADSLSAVKKYREFKIKVDNAYQEMDKVKRQKEVEDSIYKCKHTYQ